MTTALPVQADESSSIALELRLRALEAQLYGVPPSILDSTAISSFDASTSSSHSGSSKPVTRRLLELTETLDKAFSESDALKLLYINYERYLPLLKGGDDDRDVKDKDKSADAKGRIRETDLVPDSTKLAIVLEAGEDIKSAERTIREIELLRSRGVDGPGSLEELVPLRSSLRHGLERQQSKKIQLDKLRADVTALIRNYDQFTRTTSDVFLSLHNRLEALEDALTSMERIQRKRKAERY